MPSYLFRLFYFTPLTPLISNTGIFIFDLQLVVSKNSNVVSLYSTYNQLKTLNMSISTAMLLSRSNHSVIVVSLGNNGITLYVKQTIINNARILDCCRYDTNDTFLCFVSWQCVGSRSSHVGTSPTSRKRRKAVRFANAMC